MHETLKTEDKAENKGRSKARSNKNGGNHNIEHKNERIKADEAGTKQGWIMTMLVDVVMLQGFVQEMSVQLHLYGEDVQFVKFCISR